MPTQRSPQAANSSSASEVLNPLRVFRAVTTTVVPEAVDLDETEWEKLEDLVCETLRSRSPSEQRQLRLFLRVIEWLPVPRYGRGFTALGPDRRRRVLSYLQDHHVSLIRTGFWGLRTLVLLGYYGRAKAAQVIGYIPDVRGWSARPRGEQQ